MICGIVATSISGCDVCTACRVVCSRTQHTHHSLKYMNGRTKHGQSSWLLQCFVCVCYFNAYVHCILFNTLHKIKETPPKVVGALRATDRVAANPESSGLRNIGMNIKIRTYSLLLAPEEVPLCGSKTPDSTAARRETRSTRRLSSSRTCF